MTKVFPATLQQLFTDKHRARKVYLTGYCKIRYNKKFIKFKPHNKLVPIQKTS